MSDQRDGNEAARSPRRDAGEETARKETRAAEEGHSGGDGQSRPEDSARLDQQTDRDQTTPKTEARAQQVAAESSRANPASQKQGGEAAGQAKPAKPSEPAEPQVEHELFVRANRIFSSLFAACEEKRRAKREELDEAEQGLRELEERIAREAGDLAAFERMVLRSLTDFSSGGRLSGGWLVLAQLRHRVASARHLLDEAKRLQ